MAHIFFERLENRQSTQALYAGGSRLPVNKPVASEWRESPWVPLRQTTEYASPIPWTPPGGDGRVSGFISYWWSTVQDLWEQWAFDHRMLYAAPPWYLRSTPKR